MLQEAVQRLRERSAATKLGNEEFGERVSCAIPCAMWKAKKGEAQHKHILKAATCQALWTRDRAQAGGYLPPSLLCPLCSQPDGLFHGIWKCKSTAAVAMRTKFASQATIALALSDPHLLQWTTGLAPVPIVPAPLGSEMTIFPWSTQSKVQSQLVFPKLAKQLRTLLLLWHLILQSTIGPISAIAGE